MGISSILSALGFLRESDRKKTRAAAAKGREFDRNETMYGKGLNELQQIGTTDYDNPDDGYANLMHKNFVRDFEGILGLSGKESNGGKIGNVLTPWRKYAQDVLGERGNGAFGDGVLGDISDNIEQIQSGCDTYISMVKNPWTKSGKRRLAIVKGLRATLGADLVAVREATRWSAFHPDWVSHVKQNEEESTGGQITALDLVAALKKNTFEREEKEREEALLEEIEGKEE